MHPFALLIAFMVWVLVFLPTRYVSLSSICASLAFPIMVVVVFGMFVDKGETLTMKIFSLAACLIIIYTHRSNIKRLLKSEESKTVFRKKVVLPPKAK